MGRYIDALKFRREYISCILSQKKPRDDSVADFQEYARGRKPRYDIAISGREDDEEMNEEYGDGQTKAPDSDGTITGRGNIGRCST